MLNRTSSHCSLGIDPQPRLAVVGPRWCRRSSSSSSAVPRGAPVSRAYQNPKDYLDFEWDTGLGIDDAKSRYDDFMRVEAPAYTSTHRTRRSGGFNSDKGAWNHFDDYESEIYDEYEEDLYDDEAPITLSDEKRFLNGKAIQTNHEITQPLLRLIGDKKEPMGMKTRDAALQMALESRMDLILINPQEAPPVARLMQWSKFKFEIEQGEKTKKAKAVVQETKEIRISPKTDDNDISTKIKSAQRFLIKGNKVKLVMKFEGRQLQHKDHGKEVLMKFLVDLGEIAKVEGPLSFKGSMYQVILIPGKMPAASQGSAGPSASSSQAEAAEASVSRVDEEPAPALQPSLPAAPAPIARPPPISAPGLPIRPAAPAAAPGMPIRPPPPGSAPGLPTRPAAPAGPAPLRPLSPMAPGNRPVGSPGPGLGPPPPHGVPLAPLPPLRPPSLQPVPRPLNSLQTASREQ